METLEFIGLGLQTALSPSILWYCFVGVFLGTLIGVLPGIGPLAAISLLLPVTFYMSASEAIVMLAGVYYGAQYGGSTAAILLRLPGTASSAVACLDGHPMAMQGRAGVALFITTIASFFGAMFGLTILILFSPHIAQLGLMFGSAEYFMLMLLGLVAACTFSNAPLRGGAMVVLGLLISMIGTDTNSGVIRYTFGMRELAGGLTLVAMAMGLFGLADIIRNVNLIDNSKMAKGFTLRSMLPNPSDWRLSLPAMGRGSLIGSFFGALPGAGTSISAYMAYAGEKRLARKPERFGNGAIEGVSAPEAANNASAQTAFVPTLTLGIPGDVTMALMLGALIMHGITPGPQLITTQTELFWGLVVSFMIGNIMLLFLNIPMIGIWVNILRIPYRWLYPAILIFIGVGVFSVNNSVFEIYTVVAIGALAYILAALRFEPAPLLLGFILGPLMEEYFRRALLLSRGNLSTFVDRPISFGILMTIVALLALLALQTWRRRSPKTGVSSDAP
ncbi:MAG: tripartite tricarboxylate transporter permease [Rhodobacteraceae bacterium]|nr:tripartite tricarboxylate transporter permease [Paracoccaceae bacterium]